jgi:capsular polysaccharide biosynthesis protein
LPKFKINKGVWIIDNWSYEYFHWLTDALPRLIVAEEYIENHEILLPSKFRKSPYVDSLKVFNFNISFFNSKYPVSVKELIIPSHTAPTGNYNKDVINKLRKRFNQNSVKVIPSKKIFVSRGKARFRKISNEAEVIRLVMSFGYEVHYFEDYSFRDQVSLMQQATHLIGLHGAGLTNMLFMPENGKVLELRNANDDHNNCFYALASDLGHEYYYLLNQGDAADTHFVNITVRTEELASVLQQIDND